MPLANCYAKIYLRFQINDRNGDLVEMIFASIRFAPAGNYTHGAILRMKIILGETCGLDVFCVFEISADFDESDICVDYVWVVLVVTYDLFCKELLESGFFGTRSIFLKIIILNNN